MNGERNMDRKEYKILCLDDEPQILKLLENIVDKMGFSILKAENIAKAVELINSQADEIVLIISDYKLPDGNGLDFRTAIFPQFKNIPFIILSAFVTVEMTMAGMNLKVSSFLEKPVKMADLRAVIEREIPDRLQTLEEKKIIEKIFVTESKNILDDLEPLLLSLESAPDDQNTLNTIFRLVHTVKGSSGCLESNALYKFSHHFEDLLSSLKDRRRKASAEVISVLLKGLDVLKEMVGALESKSNQAFNLEELIKLFDEKNYVSTNSGGTGGGAANAATANGASPQLKTAVADKKADQETLRVPTRTLDEFMELSGEITVIRNMVNKLVRSLEKDFGGNRDVALLSELLEEMHKINNRMQGKVVDMRKVPLKDVCRPLPRTIRDLSQSLQKDIVIVTDGEELRIDTAISQVLSDSLIHLIRNSADHGIETPEIRTAAGKSKQGTIRIKGFETRDEVIVEISDDGRGIDKQRVSEKALEKGIASAEDLVSMSESRILSLIFEPGFSTAAQVTSVSGRGVGMDMVKTSVEKMRGRIDVESASGKGTKFSMHLPIPRSVLIINSLLVITGGQTFAVPQDNILHLLRLDEERQKEHIGHLQGTRVLYRDGKILPLVVLAHQLGLKKNNAASQPEGELCILVLESDESEFGLVIDEILDGEEIVVKPLAKHLRHLNLFAGATFLGVGGVCLILDTKGLATHAGLHFNKNSEAKSHRELEQKSSRAEHQELILFTLLERSGLFGIDSKLIHRLEELPASEIQESAEQLVCVYRDKLMPIYDLGELLNFKRMIPANIKQISARKSQDDVSSNIATLIVSRDERYFGLCIESFVDIAISDQPIDPSVRDRNGILGNVFIGDASVCVVGVDEILKLAGYTPQVPVAKTVAVEIVSPLVPLDAPVQLTPPALIQNTQKVELIEDDGILWVV